MPIPSLPLEVRQFEGDEWPEKRISLSSGDYAVMISPRYASLDKAKQEAQFIADSVNAYADSLNMVERMREALKAAKNGDHIEGFESLLQEADKYLEDNAFDR